MKQGQITVKASDANVWGT